MTLKYSLLPRLTNRWWSWADPETPVQTLKFMVFSYVVVRAMTWLIRSIVCKSPFRHIPGPKPRSWFKGNLGQLFNAKGLPFHQSLVDNYGGMVKVYGFFGDEQLYVSDPRALQHIVMKFQDAFEETAVFTETNRVIFGPGLVGSVGEQHKRQRKLVSPIFALPHLKRLLPTFYNIAEKLAFVMEREVMSLSRNKTAKDHNPQLPSEPKPSAILDMSEWMSRVALESVGQAIFGYSLDPLDSPHNNPYTSAVKELIPTLFSLSLVRQFAPFLVRLGPPWFRRKLVEWTPIKSVQKVMGMSDVMHTKAVEILAERRQIMSELVKSGARDDAVKEHGGTRDIISVLLKANETAETHERLTDLELTGQMTVLVFGAQDTTSSLLSRILYQLALHEDVQEGLRREMNSALSTMGTPETLCEGNRRLGLDDITRLPLLEAVIRETLRLYPPVPFVRRSTIKERTIPYTSASRSADSSDVNSVTIPVGTILFVSIAGANRLEAIWGPDAKQWRPQRWLQEDGMLAREHEVTSGSIGIDHQKARLPGIYHGMLSFLGGNRSCVGIKFAQIEIKIILVTLLLKFRFSLTRDEIVWNLSQIISPSVRRDEEEKKGLPLLVSLA